MVPAHFHDVNGDLSDHSLGKIFGLSKILTVIFSRILIGITRSLLLCFVLFSSSDTFTGCSGVAATVFHNLSDPQLIKPTRASTSSAEVSEYVL